MYVRVTCAGVVIGTARFSSAQGIAHTVLTPTADYTGSSRAARALGRRLAQTEYWPPGDGDFARAAASRWKGGRLALEDQTGRALDVRNIVLLEGRAGGPDDAMVRVVADFRPPQIRVEVRDRSVVAGDDRPQPSA